MTAATATRPVFQVLLSLAGLVVWAGHFTAIYAISALACERGWVERDLAGLPLVPAAIGIATLLAFALLGLILRRSAPGLAAPLAEGGEAEPRFSRWLAASIALLAALAVIFQTVPALMLAGCA